MAGITLPNGIRIALEFNIQDKVVVNVYHITTTDPIVTIKLQAVATLFVNWWLSDLDSLFSHDIALAQVTAWDVSIPNGEKHVVGVVPPAQGFIASPAPSNNVAFVVSHKTAKTGRSFMGRTYLCGFPLSTITDNEIEALKATNTVAAYVILDSLLAAANSQLVVASFVSGGVPRIIGVATPVTGFVMRLRVDTQRRRLPVE